MAKPPLSMKPTGWFQVAWSEEIGVGDVHRMKYFDQDMVAWRAESGQLTVMNAYCEHLGAHLGYGGKVVGEVLQCPFHGWQWNHEGRNVCIPYQDRPNRGRRIRTYPVVERNESVYIWHDVERREPFFDAPTCSPLSATAAARTTTTRSSGCTGPAWSCIRSTCWKTGSTSRTSSTCTTRPIVPVFTRHDFDEPVSFVDFTITFEGDDGQKIEDVNSGVEAINGGLGIAVTKSWGMIDNRTISAITPVDECTSDVRFIVYIGRTPGKDPDPRRGQGAGVRPGSHPAVRAGRRHLAAPALLRSARAGHRASTRASPQFASGPSSSIPTASVAAPPKCTQHPRKAESNECTRWTDPRLPGRHRQRRLGDDQADRHPPRPRTHWRALLFAGQDRPGRRRARRPRAQRGHVTGTIEEIIAAKPDVVTFHGVFPDEDLYVKVLEAGINIVTTADWITGWHRDTNHPHPSGKLVSQVLAEACAKGGATFYGTGMNPGLNQILGVVCSADVADIENVTTIESVDVSCHHSQGHLDRGGLRPARR